MNADIGSNIVAPALDSDGFIARHSLWSDEQREAAERISRDIEEAGLRNVRISWGDQHGILRSKTASIRGFLDALRGGIDFQSATLAMDTTNNIFVPLFAKEDRFGVPGLRGFPDVILVPDPLTFKILPWVENTGWVLSDMYFPDGQPVPFCTRHILREQLRKLAAAGYEYTAGLEVEFYITKLEDPMLAPEQSGYPPDPPQVSALAHGFQYLTENRNDEIDDVLQELGRNVEQVGIPLRSMEDEWGPGQVEFTFDPRPGLEAADAMLLFRAAIKQICRRRGLHATFMSRPALANFFSSGWHLHQSLWNIADECNAFTRHGDGDDPISSVGRNFAGGLIEYANAAAIFTNPTINGYKRFQPNSFAPTKAGWAYENRGAMVRVIGAPGSDATHLENRIGEPAANPYLYMASQVASGMVGMERGLDPGPFDRQPYEADRTPVPLSLIESIEALEGDSLFRDQFGTDFVDYMIAMKRSEWSRFLAHVSDWEQREYFEVY